MVVNGNPYDDQLAHGGIDLEKKKWNLILCKKMAITCSFKIQYILFFLFIGRRSLLALNLGPLNPVLGVTNGLCLSD